MKIINKTISRLDSFQQRYRLTAFIYAVVKKYNDDESGYQASLLTYYGFLSLFPLLLILSTFAGWVAAGDPSLQHDIVTRITNYFPILGTQLQQHIGSLHKYGLALIVGLLFTLYGARGVADVFRRGVQDIWGVPKEQRPTFPTTIINSLSIIIVAASGLIIASTGSSIVTAAGRGVIFQLLAIGVNLLILFGMFILLLNLCLPKHVSIKEVRSGAITAAIGLVALQLVGSLILSRQLGKLDGLYSYFAIALGLMLWIYLQAQMVYYAVTISVVHTNKLWPRTINE